MNIDTKYIDENNIVCPYCNSSNIKEYLYGEPPYDYDKDKYELGGCEVGIHKPKYKCMNCGKDLYREEREIKIDLDLYKDLKKPCYRNNWKDFK